MDVWAGSEAAAVPDAFSDRLEHQSTGRLTLTSSVSEKHLVYTHAFSSVMDWARDNAELSTKDLDNVFKYEVKSTTVVRMLSNEEVGLRSMYW